MKKIVLAFLFLSLVTASCQYRPFLKYYFPSKKTHFPAFTKWEKTIGTNTNPLRACYDVTCYDWYVSVHPKQKSINSVMKIYFRMEFNQDSIILDLQRHLHIDGIKCSVPLKKVKRKKDVLYIVFDHDLKKGDNVMVEITYHGTPVKILNYTTINWEKDKTNKPWICTATEGIGPHHMMPCKNLLNDEPDSCFIRVGVPKELVAVANGKLDGITETTSEKIYNWSVKNPINIYNISFNIGDYVKLEKDYRDINNVDHKIQVYALSYNKAIADTFYNQAPLIMQNLEKAYGTYPWWSDGCKIIESCLPNGLCMEHQSAISMGDGYRNVFKHFNLNLVHELSHEWWGNNLTGYDYADLWLHEGLATYSEALFLETMFGKQDYIACINYFSKLVYNKRPVLKPYGVAYNCLVHNEDNGDIYNKGALFIHTLRMQLNNDEIFFKILREAQQTFAKSNITTAEFLSFFNEKTKKDFTPYFDVYLKQISPPILEYRIDKSKGDSAILEYKWAEELQVNFKMKVTASIGDSSVGIYPTASLQQLKFSKQQKCSFDLAKFGYVLLKEIKQ